MVGIRHIGAASTDNELIGYATEIRLRAERRAGELLKEMAERDERPTRAIQHYLGHRSIASTVRYSALAPDRFKGFWKGLNTLYANRHNLDHGANWWSGRSSNNALFAELPSVVE
jgi:hypothetical protein